MPAELDPRMIADGVWCDCRQGPAERPRPGLFVDRDGTLIDLVDYISRPEDVRLIPAAVELLRAANRAGIPVVVVTNQSGIARGMFGWEAFLAVQRRTDELLTAEGVAVAGVLACAHGPATTGTSAFRKPAPGMLLAAIERLGLTTEGSWIVGDNSVDLEAGRYAGLSQGWLVETGHGRGQLEAARLLADARFSVVTGKPLAELARRLPSPK